MEYLRTPEPVAAAQAAAAAYNSATPRTPNNTTGTNSNNINNINAATPAAAVLDRAGIKSSFQTLFTPNHAPAYLPAASGLTPFLTAGATPNFITPGIGMMPMGSPPQGAGKHSAEIMLSSPYLQAAAKEAVRREFMNMPSYITGNPPPGVHPVGSPPQQQVYSADGRPVVVASTPPVSDPAKAATAAGAGTQSQASCENDNGVVPTDSATNNSNNNKSLSNDTSATADDSDSESAAKVPPSASNNPKDTTTTTTGSSSTALPAGTAPVPAAMPYAGHQPPFFAPPGVFLMPQMMAGHLPGGMPHAQMNGGMFVHSGNGGMMMAYPGVGMPGMPNAMMMMPMGAAMGVGASSNTIMGIDKPIPKHETNEQRKARVEEEKQELIREFKKKTREAALVRFRQKRRERRFGKLIRYACRKQLADARPRVKGRFVRIKENDSDDSSAAKKDNKAVDTKNNGNKKNSKKSNSTSRSNKKSNKNNIRAVEEAPQVVPNMN